MSDISHDRGGARRARDSRRRAHDDYSYIETAPRKALGRVSSKSKILNHFWVSEDAERVEALGRSIKLIQVTSFGTAVLRE